MSDKIKVLILHGTGGDSEENWFPWMKEKLESSGNYEVYIPDLPNSDYPESEVWLGYLEKFKDKLGENSIIIGHSLGCPAAWQFIEKNDLKIDRLFLVAPAFPKMNYDLIEKAFTDERQLEKVKNFTNKLVDWKSVQSSVNNITIFFSKDDPYIPFSTKELCEKNLNASYKIYEDKKHFNVFNAGERMRQFPELLDEILG